MVRVNYKQKIANMRKVGGRKQKKYVSILTKDMQVAKRYADFIQEKISEIVRKDSNETIEDKWQKYKNVIVASAENILGLEERDRNEWYDGGM
jgi:chloramphenicol O-acetyltransferase